MQSWGTTSRFDQRDTGKEPSKSGVLGILAAAMGIDRESWLDLEPLTRLTMTMRHDRPGVPKYDYQTAGCAAGDTIIKADGKPSKDGVVSERFYLADAAFLVVLNGDDRRLLKRAHAALRNPKWPLALGRKSYVPSTPIYVENGIQDDMPSTIVRRWPWITALRRWETAPNELLVSSESADGSGVLRMDQLLSSFAERRFGARFVTSEWIPFPNAEDAAA
jgi:CRISPR system Cascade subunit CasD